MDAEISITKKVLKGTKECKVDDTFYAGIFFEDGTLYEVVELIQNGTVTRKVPLGGENGAEPVVYYVYETDSNGQKIDKTQFAYEVSGEGSVKLDVNNINGRVKITNAIEEEEPEEETEEKDKSVKTGDDTPILPNVSLMLTSLLTIIVLLNRKRKMFQA